MFIWTIVDAITVGFVLVILAVGCWAHGCIAIRQARCKHDGGVNETQACDAICRQCGKNLGFIDTWRKQSKDAR